MRVEVFFKKTVVSKKVAGIKIVKYEALEDLLSRLWDITLSLPAIRKMKFDMVCIDMKKRKLSGADFVRATLKDGIYGFAYPITSEIHFWCKDNVSKKKLLGFFGHEVGHLREKLILKLGKKVKNEIGAEKFAEAIRLTLEIVQKIVEKLFPLH